jgi:tRNA-Thr(GGU) m(6)t(6)A37 methyltransferase TsaA
MLLCWKKRAVISTIATAGCIMCVGPWAAEDRNQTLSGDNPLNGLGLRPIGVIHTPFREPQGTPIQPAMADGARGTVTVFEEFQDGLKDLEGFERSRLICWFHLAAKARLLVRPFLDDKRHGVFATRAPARPNPIGISSVRALRVENDVLTVADADIVDGTPLLDIKPYAPALDSYRVKRSGWLNKACKSRRVADGAVWES